MAVTIIEPEQFGDNTWSLERPMYYIYTKDADNSNVIVTIDITQGTYSKTLTLKYSGLIKEVKLNISNLVKNYFQHSSYTAEEYAFNQIYNSNIYLDVKTQTVNITIADSINSKSSQTYFVKNASGNFETVPSSTIEQQSASYNKEDKVFFIPEKKRLFNTLIGGWGHWEFGFDELIIDVNRRKLDGTLIDTFNYPTVQGGREDQVIFIPVGSDNTGETEGVIVELVYSVDNSSTITEIDRVNYTFNYTEKCDTTKQRTVYFEGQYGGIDTITFANDVDAITSISNKFTLEGGRKIKVDPKHRYKGSLISEYIDESSQNIYKALHLSDVVQMEKNGEIIDIILTNPQHRIKQIGTKTMVQYTFAYEEVERLKY